MRPRSADTSEPACVKRKMLSTKRRTSWPSASRKYSATVSAERATRARAPGGLAGIGEVVRGLDGAGFVDRPADHVENAAERAAADGHHDRAARVGDDHVANESVGRIHGDRAHRRLTEVLGHLENEVVLLVA